MGLLDDAFFEDEVAAEVFLAHVGVVGELAGCALLENGAFVEEVGVVSDAECFADVVVGDEDADVALFEFDDDVLDVLYGDGVDAGERFVEEEEEWVVGEGAGYLGASALAAGELYAFAVAYVLEVELVEEGVEFFFTFFLGVEVFSEFEDGHDVVGYGHLAEDGGFLGEVSDTHLCAAVHGVAREFDGLAAFAGRGFEEHFAGVGLDDADDHVEGGGFAGAVGAEEADDLSLADFDAHAFDDGAGAIHFDDVVGVESH